MILNVSNLTMNLMNKLVDLRFQVLRNKMAGNDEVNDFLNVIQQLLNTPTVGLFVWDEALTTVYPLGVLADDKKELTSHVSQLDASVWQTSSEELAQQIENDNTQYVTFPLQDKEAKVGIFAFIAKQDGDYSQLQEIVSHVNDFLLCVDLIKQNIRLQKESVELSQTKNNLEDTLKISTSVQSQLERVATELKVEADKSEKANQAKSEFLSSMSHELRTPLNIILGFAQLLSSDDLTKDQHENVNEILMAGDHLLDMVDEVLDLSKMESGKVELSISEVDIVSLVKSCVDLIKPMAEKKGIKINNEVTLELEGKKLHTDQTKLREVLINLLSNAVKYNKNDGSITIKCNPAGNENLKFEVIDTGLGISSEHFEKAFHAFERLALVNGSVEGVGIGLAICKSLIESMRGEIGVESTLGEGSCFWLILPYKIPA